jgi:tetratricopeptide (TPR) repeat protein
MKKLFLVKYVICVLMYMSTAQVIIAQNNQLDFERQVLSTYAKYNDIKGGIMQLARLITLQPSNIYYKDTLANLYFTSGQYLPCLSVCAEYKDSGALTANALLLMAKSYAALGLHKEAIGVYEKICMSNNRNCTSAILYALTKSQITIGRADEALVNLNTIIADTSTLRIYTIEQSTNGNQIEINITAAAYNSVAVIFAQRQDYSNALLFLGKSIAADKNNTIAMDNINAINDLLKINNTPKKEIKKANTKSGS